MDTLVHAQVPIAPETSTPASFSGKPGGVATNIARSLGRLGVSATLLGALGQDSAADTLLKQLRSEGIDLLPVVRPGHATGQYIAFHNPDGSLAAACVDDRILSDLPTNILDAVVADAARAHEGAFWFVDANLPEALLTRVADLTPSRKLIANAVSNAKAPRLAPILDKLACLMLNKGEAAALTGLDVTEDGRLMVERLRMLGVQQIVLTDGQNGILADDGRDVGAYAVPTVEIVDVTGAGDALAAGILAALVRGMSLAEAVPIGQRAAAMVLRVTGALADDLSWEAIQQPSA